MDLALVRHGKFNPIAVIFFLTVMVLLALAVAVPRGQDVLWLNGWHNTFLDLFFLVFTNAGDGVLFVPLVVIFLFVRFYLAVVLAASAAIHAVLISIFKRWLLAGATRPVMELDHSLLHFVPGVDIHAHHSFPSGHTASIFAIAFFLALTFDRKIFTGLFFALAVVVASSRIYLLQHFLSDVAGGALIGVVSVVLAIVLFERFDSRPFFQRRMSLRRSTAQGAKDAPVLDE